MFLVDKASIGPERSPDTLSILFPPSPRSSESSPLSLQVGRTEGRIGWEFYMGWTWKGTCNFPPEFSHLATFTAGMVGNTIQVFPGSWEAMFGD